MTEQTRRKNERIRKEINQTMEEALPLPEGFKKWCRREAESYLVYEPGNGNKAVCTCCGAEVNLARRLKLAEVRRCPACRKRCYARTPKRMPGRVEETFIFIQKIRNGIMVRFVVYGREYAGSVIQGEYFEEYVRVAVRNGKRQYWYEKREFLYDNGKWYRNNIKGWIKHFNSPVYMLRGKQSKLRRRIPVYRVGDMRKQIRETNLRYIRDLEELLETWQERKNLDNISYALLDVVEEFKNPGMESLWKLDFRNLVFGNDNLRINKKEKELHKMLGISKEMWRFLLEHKEITRDQLQTLQFLTKKQKESPEIIWKAAVYCSHAHARRLFAGKVNIKKTMRYLNGHDRWTYMDYLDMARQEGFDLSDDFVRFPRNLEQAHDSLVEQRLEAQARKKAEKERIRDVQIAKVEKKIRKKFSFEDSMYLIRPARSNWEILEEGQKQHICVGYGGYADKMIKGESFILLLRKKNDPERPYYTVEMSPEYKVLQRHGKYNREGEEVRQVDDFLKQFVEVKKNGKEHHAGK